ncbi:DMT family transporter [Alsobacter sp. KACC 23698]|uniref:DMT family transporter n=1 Tax=Alsobacter sp. KACC 23698 TaxID=3149229 RepID=A0AAU7JIL1_9HYPH
MSTFVQNRRGVLAMLAAMAVFTTSDALMKLVRTALPPGEVVFVRGLFAVLFSVALLVGMGHVRDARRVLAGPAALRAGVEAIVALCFVTALGHMALADLTAIGQSSPILIAVFCAVTGLEPMGWRRWAAVLTGFAGVLLVVRPTGESFDVYTLVALLSAVFVAVRDLVTRRIHPSVPTAAVLAATSTAVCAAGAVLGLAEDWIAPTPAQWAGLGGAGLAVALGHLCVITAFRGVDVTVVSPFRYSVIVWAILAGAAVFGEIPDATTLAGATLVVGSGVYTVHRERIRARDAARELGTADA